MVKHSIDSVKSNNSRKLKLADRDKERLRERVNRYSTLKKSMVTERLDTLWLLMIINNLFHK